MPFLQLSYTDKSGTTHPQAVFEIVGLHLELNRDGIAGDIQISGYHDMSARQNGRPPFEARPPSPLTAREIAALEGQFAVAVYQILQQRREFSTAQVVT